MKQIRKKGVFFTFAAIFIVILIVSASTTRQKFRYREKSEAISVRVNTIDDFIGDFEKDFEREIFIGGYRALISMNSYIRFNQGYLADIDSVFAEILVNGTANGTEMDLMKQDTQGADITSWLERINEESSLMNIHTDITVNEVSLEQTSPWNLTASVNASIIISDEKGLASWHIEKEYIKEFSIFGFEDPLYIVETSDRVTNLINITPDFDFVDESNDTTVLNAHLLNSYYINSTSAPSFLMRLAGNFSPSPYGIESMVNLEDLNAQGISTKSRSLIDYIYFWNQTTTNYCNVTGLPSWFRIDDSHREIYQVEGLSTVCS